MATRINAPSHILESTAQGLFRVPKMAIVAEVKNHDLLAKSIEKLIDHANQTLRGMPMQPIGLNPGEIVRLKNGKTVIAGRPSATGIPIAGGSAPHAASGPEDARSRHHARHGAKARDLAESPPAGAQPSDNPLTNKLDWLPGNLTMLSVADTAQSVYPELIVGLPRLLESMIKPAARWASHFS